MNLVDKFLDFEESNELLLKKIDDFQYWAYLRFSIYTQISMLKEGTGMAHERKVNNNLLSKLRVFFRVIKNCIFKNPIVFLKPKDIIVLNHPRKIKNGDVYECKYTEEILKNIDKSYYVFERPYVYNHFKPISTKNIRYMDLINACSLVYKNLAYKKYYRLIMDNIEDNISDLIYTLNEYFDVKLDVNRFIKSIVDLYIEHKIKIKMFDAIIKRVKPKLIMEVVSYSTDNMIINEIAHQRNILVIELQHGTMGRYHIAYNYIKRRQYKFFPDKLFVFSDYWKSVTRLPIEDENVIAVGFPYLDKVIKCKTNICTTEKYNIIFISQGTIGEELSKLAVQLYTDLSNLNIKFSIIYKLHPGEYSNWEQRYPWLKEIEPLIKVIDDNSRSIYEYFFISNIQIGVYSTAILEGLAFNLYTYIYKIFGSEYMEDLCSGGYGKYILSASDVVSDLLKQNQKYNTNYGVFWKSNSVNNIVNLIDEHIGN